MSFPFFAGFEGGVLGGEDFFSLFLFNTWEPGIKYSVQLGFFRKYGDSFELNLFSNCSLQDIKSELAKKLDPMDVSLIDESAIANDSDIINEEITFSKDTVLAILPPVCGG